MAAPTITSISPDNGPVGGGTLIKVVGTNFVNGGTTVTINGVSVTSLSVSSTTLLYFRTPAGYENCTGSPVDLTITTADGSVAQTLFRYSSYAGLHNQVGDRIKETSTSTGTGNMTLAGVPSGYFKSFASRIEHGSIVPYFIINQSAAEYEVGIGTYYDNYLSRDCVFQSSNNNAKVSFSAGTKEVTLSDISGYADSGREFRTLLENSSFTFWQRQAPGTLTSRTDGQYGPDRWYVLTQTAGVQVVRADADAPYAGQAYSASLLQNQASAQRMGLATALWSRESISARRKQLRLQANLYASTARSIMYAVLEWTGTADSVTRDVVLDWTSTTYITGSFFVSSNLTLNCVGEIAINTNGGTANCNIVTSPVSSTCNNLIVFFWSKETCPQNDTIAISVPVLVDDPFPRRWKTPNYYQERESCLASFCKTFPIDTAPANNAGFNGSLSAQSVGSTLDPEICWRFPVIMRKTPTITLYNPDSGTAGQWDEAGSAALANARAFYIGDQGCTIDNSDTKPAGGQSWFIHATAEADPCV